MTFMSSALDKDEEFDLSDKIRIEMKGFIRPEGCTCEIVGTEIKLCPKCKKELKKQKEK